MNRIVFASAILMLAMAAFACRTFASEGKTLTVIASLPDFADIAHEIGGRHVNVEAMAKGTEDTHGVHVRPSLAAKLARADVLIEMGLEMEHAWLPALVDAANNPKIKHGKIGNIVASENIAPKEVPTVYSRTEGEQHPAGNPHMNIGPDNGRAIAKNICEGLIHSAPEFKEEFEANLKKYLDRLEKKEAEWKELGKPLKGIKFVSFHPDMAYLADFYEMEEVGTIEPKPGIPPSPSHTTELIKKMKERGAKLILREPHYSDKMANEIAEQTGTKVVTVAIMVNGLPDAKSWIEMVDANLNALLKAVK